MEGLTIKSPAVLEILTSYLNVSEAAVTRNQRCGCDAAIIFSVRREDWSYRCSSRPRQLRRLDMLVSTLAHLPRSSPQLKGKDTCLGQAERSKIQKIHVDDVSRPHPHVRRHFPKLLFSSLPTTWEHWKKHLHSHDTTTNGLTSTSDHREVWSQIPKNILSYGARNKKRFLWVDRQPGWLSNRLHDNNAAFATSLCFMATLASQF